MGSKYILLSDSTHTPEAKKGTIVYSCRGSDYGCASDDSRITGVEHVSMTLKEDGGYPFFTHPRHMMKRVEED